MVSRNMGRQIDAKQWDSYNETYSTLKTEYEGWSSRRKFCVRRWVWVCLPAQSQVEFRAMPSMVYEKDLRRNSRTISKEFSNS